MNTIPDPTWSLPTTLRRMFQLCSLLSLLVILGFSFLSTPVSAGDFDDALSRLTEKSFKKKRQALEVIEQTGGAESIQVFQALLDARLYYRKSDKSIVLTDKTDEGYAIQDILSGENLGVVGKREIKKIRINNQLRGFLRGAIARLTLSSDAVDVRRQAVQQMLQSMDEDSRELLQEVVTDEPDPGVRELMLTGIALADLESSDDEVRLQAVARLAESLQPEVRNRLRSIVDTEADSALGVAAAKVLGGIESRIQVYDLMETVFFGLSLGSVLLLAAIGLAITFGVMGVINMAHGELIMLGAYTTYLLQLAMPNYADLSLLLAIPAAFIVSGLFGIAIERGVISFLYGRPLETLLATFGISLVLQQLVRSTISAQNVVVSNPSWMSGSLQINPALSITYNRLFIFFFALLVFAILQLILKKTRLGLHVRAVSQNRNMARAMGIRSRWVDAMTFGLGSGIAGVAGVALSQLTNVGPNMGQAYIIDSFMVVVFGGVGNLWGTLIGALSLGVGNKFLEPYAGAVLAKILVLVFIILFIQKRPRGLFPQKGRAA